MIVYCKYGQHSIDTNEVEVYQEGEEIGPDLFHFPIYICEDCAEELEEIEDELEGQQPSLETEQQRVYNLFLQKLEARYPGHPWVQAKMSKQEIGTLKYGYEEWIRGLPPMPAPTDAKD